MRKRAHFDPEIMTIEGLTAVVAELRRDVRRLRRRQPVVIDLLDENGRLVGVTEAIVARGVRSGTWRRS